MRRSWTDSLAPDDGGFVAVWMAVLATLLVVFVGFAVDLGNWQLHSSRVQGAAEASALGGVTALPEDPAGADDIARRIASLHGFDPSDPNVSVSVALADGPNQLEVTISRRVRNYFTALVGVNTTTVRRTAVAEFAPPVEMGSPVAVMGNDPEAGYSPDFWLSQAGGAVSKENGDQFVTRNCDYVTTYQCSGTRRNLERTGSSYYYVARVTDPTQPLRIQVFDPIWAWVGSDCSLPFWPTEDEIASLQAAAATNPQIPIGYYDDAATRYAGGNDAWCTGDDFPNIGAGPTRTVIRVFGPDDTPWTNTDNPFVGHGCSVTFNGTELGSPYSGAPTIHELLSPDVGSDTEWQVLSQPRPTATFAESFRRWYTVCDLPAAVTTVGDYLVEVTTNNTGGQNRFSLRAGPPQGSGIADIGQSVFAQGRFPIFANADSADTEFYIARVPPGATERILRLTFFDVGDAASPGEVRILPPSDANIGAFDDCVFTRSDGVGLTTSGPCGIANVSRASGYDGTLVEAQITIPASYECALGDPKGCWVKVVADFAGGVTDFTTWTAEIEGDAIRLVR